LKNYVIRIEKYSAQSKREEPNFSAVEFRMQNKAKINVSKHYSKRNIVKY